MMTYPVPAPCPRCGLFDQVQKVSALYHAGASTSMITGSGVVSLPDVGSELTGSIHLTGGQQTLLSQRLSPPAQPQLQSAWGTGNSLVLGACVLGAVCSCSAASAAVGFTEHWSDFMSYTLVSALIFIAATVALVWRTSRETEQNKARWQADYLRWQTSVARWEALYYCGRDDLVFVPGMPVAAPASAMWTLL